MKMRLSVMSLVLVALALGGCQSDPYAVDYDSISNNLSPELMTLANRDVDVDRITKQTNNVNERMVVDDLMRTFYTDRPSWLSPTPITATSGMWR